MAHFISGIIGKLEPGQKTDNEFALPFYSLKQGFMMIGLHEKHMQKWQARLSSAELLNFKCYDSQLRSDQPIVHFWANRFFGPKYALIETEYFGGEGGQMAALFESGILVESSSDDGAINKTLQKLGVKRSFLKDEFDAMELGKYRNFNAHYLQFADEE